MTGNDHVPGTRADDDFYRRIHWRLFDYDKGRPTTGLFYRPRESVNYAAMSSVDETRGESNDLGVGVISASACWDAEQTIEPSPTKLNRAHCDVVGSKNSARVRTKLRDGIRVLVAPTAAASSEG